MRKNQDLIAAGMDFNVSLKLAEERSDTHHCPTAIIETDAGEHEVVLAKFLFEHLSKMKAKVERITVITDRMHTGKRRRFELVMSENYLEENFLLY